MSYTPIFGEDMQKLISEREGAQNPPRPLYITIREMAETCASLLAATVQPEKNVDLRAEFAVAFTATFKKGYFESLAYLDDMERKLK